MAGVQNYRVGYVRKKGIVNHAFVTLPSGIVLHNTPRHHIKLTTVESATLGRDIKWTWKTGQIFSDIDLVNRAKGLAGHRQYSLMSYNCEHFVEELLCNRISSPQRNKWLAAAGAAAVFLAII